MCISYEEVPRPQKNELSQDSNIPTIYTCWETELREKEVAYYIRMQVRNLTSKILFSHVSK